MNTLIILDTFATPYGIDEGNACLVFHLRKVCKEGGGGRLTSHNKQTLSFNYLPLCLLIFIYPLRKSDIWQTPKCTKALGTAEGNYPAGPQGWMLVTGWKVG